MGTRKIVINHGVTALSLSNKGLNRLAELGNLVAQRNLNDFGFILGERFYYGSLLGISRDDPNLIKVIEELGIEATDECNPFIVEIPDDIDWVVDQYDGGHEFVREKHKVWYDNSPDEPIIK